MAKAPLSTGKFLLIFISWWAIWALLQTSLLIGFGLTTGTALADSVFSNTIVALCCGFISNNMQYYLLILIVCKATLVPLLRGKSGEMDYGIFFSRSWAVRYDTIFLQVACMSIL